MKNNCTFIVLHSAQAGTVRYCRACEMFRLEPGMLWTVLSEEELRFILNDFIERREYFNENRNGEMACKKMVISLNRHNQYRALNPVEMDRVIDLLTMSMYMLEVHTLIGMEE